GARGDDAPRGRHRRARRGGLSALRRRGHGRMDDLAGRDWTGGFWNGMLWLAHARTGEDRFREWAERWTRLLERRARSETVFRGFLFYYGAALGSILSGNEFAREVGLAGARGLATLYNEKAGAIPLGTEAEEASDPGRRGRGATNVDGVQGSA